MIRVNFLDGSSIEYPTAHTVELSGDGVSTVLLESRAGAGSVPVAILATREILKLEIDPRD